jgi:hypothetical protein
MISTDWLPALQVLAASGAGLLASSIYLLTSARLKPGVDQFVVWAGLLPGAVICALALLLAILTQ